MGILGKAVRHSVNVITFVAFTITLTGCVTTTGNEARLEFAERIQQYGSNPYIQASVFKDLERRIRAIAIKDEIGQDVRKLGPRQNEILRNFSDRYDHAKLEQGMRMARADFDFITRANYPNIGTETGCKMDTSNTRFPRDTKNQTPKTFNWVFMHGDCKGGMAHGIGRARAAGNTKFVGEFDQGRMVRGIFETYNTKGERLVAIGDVPSTDLIGRTLVAVFNKSGFQWFRYADFNGDSKYHGFAINIWSYPKITVVRFVGDFQNHQSNGFGASQVRRPWGDGKVWNTWIGVYENGSLNGPGAWTNAVEEVATGEWKNGKLNGVGYSQYNDATGDYHMFDACNYVNGQRQGMCKVFHSNSFNSGEHVWEKYNNGEMVDAS
jgi:hypothetical protein